MKQFIGIMLTCLLAEYGSAQNLVTNGNFSAGNTSFNTGYILDCTIGGAIGEARYCVGTNPNSVHFAWSACGDHTTGTGNMMILNGTSTPNVIVWQQSSITVSPNTCYQFCVWATSVYPDNPAKIKLNVNGATQASTLLSSTTCAWQQICGTWFSGSATNATLTILDEDLNPGGNDLAIDDVSFIAIPTPCVTTLPVKWLYVNALAKEKTNVVEWAIDAANNTKEFIVERSYDGITFEAIGTVQSGNTNSYSFIDNTYLLGQTVFYRVKQIDSDGKFSYSSVAKLEGRGGGILLIENPVHQSLKMSIAAKTGTYNLSIYDVLGKKVYQEKINITASYLSKNISVTNFTDGLYFIVLSNKNNEVLESRKFIKD